MYEYQNIYIFLELKKILFTRNRKCQQFQEFLSFNCHIFLAPQNDQLLSFLLNARATFDIKKSYKTSKNSVSYLLFLCELFNTDNLSFFMTESYNVINFMGFLNFYSSNMTIFTASQKQNQIIKIDFPVASLNTLQ